MTLTLALIVMTAVLTAIPVSIAGVHKAARTPAEQIARTITAVWKCEDAIGQKRTRAGNVWAKHSIGYRQWQLRVWQGRLEACRQQNWKAWLPAKWYRVARCETGPNWHHANSSYVSAFGISVREYDRDAAYMGVRPWYVRGKGNPSPWEQWQAAVGHYKRFGGFSGWGCRAA